MAKSETSQIAQLDERMKSLDATLKQLITDVDAFKDRLSKANSSGIEQMRQEYQSLQKKVEEVGTSQAKTAKNVEEQIQRVSRSRRVDNKILERQNQLLAAQKRLAATGDIGQRFSTLKNSIGGIDFNSILAKANAPADKGVKMLHDSITRRSETAVRQFSSAQNEAKKSVEKTTSSIKAQKGSLESMLPTLRRLASAFGVAFSVQGLVQFGKKLIETRGEFELQQVAMRSILQNKQLADEIWDKTMQAALQSPFTAMQLTKYTKQLAAYRIETDKLFDTTKRLADVSAGLGVDMQRLILAYGQVKAANYLRASEIRQFTEAGVNVLGELRDYFNEVKGMSVGTAKVMDMVQKRLVTFSDVEAIFKRMTDQGGIFYNMQYIQSQTVKGQINKLHDAYDQMLNSIGKANEGVIKDLVAALNNIVKNWRSWAVALKSIGWAAAIGFIVRTTRVMSGLGTVSVGTLRRMASLKATIASFANAPTLATAAITALVTTMIGLDNRMREANKQIDEQNLRLFESRNNFADLKSKIEENNKTIRENRSTTETLNKAQNDNRAIINKLKEEYPDLAEQMGIATNGIIEMNGAIDTNIRKLNEQMTLISLMKQGGWLEDTGKENLEEFEADLSTITARLMTAQAAARTRMMNLEISGDTASDEYQTLKKISELDLSSNILGARDAFLELAKSMGEYSDSWLQNTWFGRWAGKVQTVGKTNYKSMKSGFGIDIDDLFYSFDEKNVKAKLDELSAPLKQYYLNGIKDNEEYMKEVNEQYGGDIIKWITRNADKINQGTLDGINKANATLIKVLNPSTPAMREYINKYYNELWGLIDKAYLERLEQQITLKRSELMRNWTIGLQSEVDAMEAELERKRNGVDLTSTAEGKGTGTDGEETPEEKKAKIDAAWRRRINLLEEMKKRYDELSKSAYGYAKSESTVRGAFDESFKEIFKGTGISMSQIDFTSMQGMFASMRLVLQQARGISEAVRDEIMKKIDSYEAQITINAQVRIREDFGRQMEEAFGNYELTLDLQKLNLPSDVLSDLFDLETVDLSDLRRKVVEFYNERLAIEADPTDLIKQVEGYYKKIDDMERKQQRDRIKDYAKYLEYELSERAKIEMEYTRKSADVAANQAFTSEQKEQIQKRLKEERDKAIAKQEWEDFKSSETYIQMMEDLEHQGTNALIAMRTELERIRENAENLSPRALKEVVNAIEKIDEITIRRGMPISNIRNAAASVRSARVEALESGLFWDQVSSRRAAKQTQADIKAQLLPMEQQFNILQSQLGAEKEIARLEQERYENGLKLGEIFGETFMTGDNEYLQELITNSLTNIESSQERINELTEQRKTASEADTKAIDQKLAEERANLECLAAERDLLEKQLELNIAISKEALNRAATPEERASLQARINELEEELKKLREQDAAIGNLTKKYGILGDSAYDAIQKISSALNDVYATTKSMMDSFGVDTDTAGWLYGDAISTTVGAISNVASKLASGDYFGAIVAGVTGIMNSIQAFNEAGDKALDKQIQIQQKRIDDLTDAYARLEKQIERTWSSVSYMQTYEQQVQNIREQIAAMEAQMRYEEDKKNTDDNAVRQYQRDIQDAYDQLEELEQKSIEVFGGIGEEGYRSAAEGFVEAWKSAFLETGDGLQGLQDHFDEFLQDWFVKQATMRIAGGMLEPVFRQIDAAVDKYGEGGTSAMLSEIERVRDMAAAIFPDLSLALEDLAGMFGVGGEGSLSGLAAGIQGMTEEKSNILEAYWNSVRMYTASIDMNVSRIAEMLGAGGPNTNPMLTELETIASHTRYIPQIYTLLTGTRRNLGNGQGFVTYNQ